MRFLRTAAGILAAVMLMFSVVSGLTYADDIWLPSDVDRETGLRFTLLEDDTYSVEDSTFLPDKMVGEVVIPPEYNGKTVTAISHGGFSRCSKITSITIPESVINIGSGAFSGCEGLTSITIPKNVITIGYSAFERCNGLYDITIPKSVESVGERAFAYCANLETINVDEDSQQYCSDDGILFNKDKTELIFCPQAKKVEKYTVPNSVKIIGAGAFEDHSELASIDLPDELVTIGEGAFVRCIGLSTVTIPESVVNIEGGALYGCENLESLTVPSGVTVIGENAFGYCKNLKYVYLPQGIKKICSYAFDETGLNEVYYEGTESQWSKIDTDLYRTGLENVIVHYNSEKPTTSNPDKPDTSEPASSDTSESTTSEPTSSDASETSEPSRPSGSLSGNSFKDVEDASAFKTTIITPKGTLVEAVLTEAEFNEYKNGADVSVVLMVEDIKGVSSDKQIADKVINELDYKVGGYLDIKLVKEIDGEEIQVNKTNSPITISFGIPSSLRVSNRNFVVVRVHNGKADILNDCDDNADTVTIRTDRFSTYVLAYSDTGKSVEVNNGNPYMGSETHTNFYFVIGIVALFILLIMFMFTGKNGMTEEQKEHKFAKLIEWGKRGGKIRVVVTLVVILLLLSFYYGIGKKTSDN